MSEMATSTVEAEAAVAEEEIDELSSKYSPVPKP